LVLEARVFFAEGPGMQRKTNSKLVAAVAAVSSGLLLAGSAKAVNYNWQVLTAGNASGSWATPTNWTPNLPAGGTTSADSVNFSLADITADSTVTLDNPQSIANIAFGDTNTSTAAGWNINATSATANNATDTLNFVPGTPTINVFGLGTGKTATINATMSNGSVAVGTWGLAKGGPGTLTLTANNSALTGIIFINNGILSLDFSHAWSPLTNIIGDTSSGSSSASHLELQGGTLNLIGSPGLANSQTFSGNTNMGIGAAEITFTQNGATSLSLNLGALSRSATSGGTVDINLPTAGAVTATSTVAAGGLIVGATGSPYVTVNNGADWAAINGANVVAGSSIAGFYTPSTTSTLAGNADLVTNASLTAATTVSSIRQNDSTGAHTIDLGGTNSLSTGGILMTPTADGALTIQNGTVTAGATNAADVMISQNNTNFPLNISAGITNNGANTTELTKDGAGTLVLSGTNTYNGNTYVNGGTLSVTGGVLGPAVDAAPFPSIQVAPGIANTATMNISGATTVINDDRFLVAGNAGNFAGGTGTVNMTGGTVNSGAWFSVGLEGAGTLNQSGGIINVIGGFAHFEVGVFGTGSAVINMSGTAALNLENGSGIGFGTAGTTGNGTFNQNSGAVTFFSDGGTTVGGAGDVVLGASGTGTYTYNLNGGNLSTSNVTRSSGTGILNLNGGTLTAIANSSFFISNLSSANVLAGGAIINTNGFNVTVPQPLLHATALGATPDGGLTKMGAGTLVLSGAATYTGPTKVAGGTLQLPSNAIVPPPTAIASYSFDTINGSPSVIGTELNPGDVINNGGSGGAAMNGTVNTASYNGFGISGLTIQAGKFGNALQFDGTGSSVDIPSTVTDMSGNAIWTLSLWAKTTTAGGAFLTKTTPTVAGDTTPQFDAGASTFYLGANPIAAGGGALPTAVRNAGGFLQSTTSVTDGAWHLITYVDNGGVRNIYVDGSLTTLSQTAFTTTDTSTGIRIGFTTDPFAGDGTANYQGDLDEVQIYNAALTQTQVQDLFTSNTITHSTPGAGGQLLPTGTDVNLSATSVTLDLNGNSQTIGSLTGVTGSLATLEAGNLTTGGDNASTTFAGVISSTGGGLIKAGTGTFTLTGANTYSGNTSVTGGALVIGAAGALPSGTNLNISANSKVAIVPHGANPRIVLQVSSLSTATTGTLDVANNDVIVHNGDLTNISNQLKQGLNIGGSLWAGTTGIVSSVAAADTRHITAVGAISNNDGNGHILYGPGGQIATSFDGVTSLATTDILVKYTYFGDANLDGKLNASDYIAIDNGFTMHLTGWANGDFNYDGTVNGDDYTLIDNAFNTQSSVSINAVAASPAAQISVSVPEPATLGLVAIGSAATLLRRRRKGR
jgi:fibronectin-binding autotransporter adhesin